MNIQHIHGVPPLYTNTFLIITHAKHGIIIDAAAEPGVYLKALEEIGYHGFLTIEREVGDQPARDIGDAVEFLRKLI